MNPLKRLYGSSVGMKSCMAVTGLVLLGFVVAHLLGNLKIFVGREAVNEYAVWLKHLPFFGIWIMRAVTLAAFLLHVATAIRLERLNTAARPAGYANRASVQTNFAGRTMILSGLLVAAYVLYHLLHFTFGRIDPAHFDLVDPQGRHDVFSMVVLGFQQPGVAAAYLAANAILALHLSHGIGSLFQSLGFNHPRWSPLINKAGPVVAVLIFLGYASIPAAVLAGLVPLPEGVL